MAWRTTGTDFGGGGGKAAGLVALYQGGRRLLASGSKQARKAFDLTSETATGFVFGLGLAYSGMARPSKVLGFLTLASDDGAGGLLPLARWDPTLPFVMGGALLLTLPAFQLLLKGRLLPKPLLGDKFGCPANNAVDRRLLLGAALFGVGWGLSGICPGPGLVSLAAGEPQVLAYVLSMAGGMVAEKALVTLG